MSDTGRWMARRKPADDPRQRGRYRAAHRRFPPHPRTAVHRAGFDRAVFREMCEMGWLGLMVPEDSGGSGLGVREFCALTEELGASLVPEPLIGAAMAARLLPEAHLADVLTGERIVLPAWQETAAQS